MSIEAVAWALRVPVGGSQKVMLLGLANHAHPDGSESYPSLNTLAEYGACDRATARRNVRKLVADGWAIEDGLGPKGQTKYRLPVGRIGGGSKKQPVESEQAGGDTDASEGVTSVQPEPSKGTVQGTEREERAQARAEEDRLFDFWRDECKHPQAKFTPERRSKVKARLAEGYTARQIAEGIRGAAKAAYVDPDTGKRYDDLELICRNGGKLEDFIGRAGLPTRTNVTPLRSRSGRPTAADFAAAGARLQQGAP